MKLSTGDQHLLWTSSTQLASFLALVTAHENAELKRVGRVIAELRESRGWTQRELEDRSGVSAGEISRIENGRRRAYADTRRKLAKALEVPVSVLTPAPPDVKSQLDHIQEATGQVLVRLKAIERCLAILTPEEEYDRIVEAIEAEEAGVRPGEGRSPDR